MKELEKYITDEKTGLKYELAGDYYFLAGDDETEKCRPIGIWGKRHLRYLRRCKKAIYTVLLIEGKLTTDIIEDIMAKPKANQKETVKFSYERIARFFPPNYSTKQMEDAIVRILEERRREVGAMPVPLRRDDVERG